MERRWWGSRGASWEVEGWLDGRIDEGEVNVAVSAIEGFQWEWNRRCVSMTSFFLNISFLKMLNIF